MIFIMRTLIIFITAQVHHEKFSCGELVARDCDMAARFTGHKVTPARMVSIHDAILGGLCDN